MELIAGQCVNSMNLNGTFAGKILQGTLLKTQQPYTFPSRFEVKKDQAQSNPEEMIGGAISGCYSMFLAALLSKKGFYCV